MGRRADEYMGPGQNQGIGEMMNQVRLESDLNSARWLLTKLNIFTLSGELSLSVKYVRDHLTTHCQLEVDFRPRDTGG